MFGIVNYGVAIVAVVAIFTTMKISHKMEMRKVYARVNDESARQ